MAPPRYPRERVAALRAEAAAATVRARPDPLGAAAQRQHADSER